MRLILAVLALCLLFAQASAQEPGALGVQVTDARADPLGAAVVEVLPGGAAAASGIRPHDVITQFAGERVTDAASLVRLIRQHRAGEQLPVIFFRPGAGRDMAFVALTPGMNAATQLPEPPANPPPATTPPAAPVSWQSFVDPNERAFSIQVPAGWRVQGGLRRANAVDVRSWVDAASPDGAIELFFDDPRVPAYTVPNPMLTMGGFREGMTYSPGYNQTFEVRRYYTGAQFAALWGVARIGRNCGEVRRTSLADLPAATEQIDMAYANGGVRTTVQAGYAEFACALSGTPAVGYVFAATELAHLQGQANDVWAVKALAGFVAAAARTGEASALLSHLVSSFAIDPQWAASHLGTVQAVSQIVAGTGQAIANSIRERFQTAWDANNANAEKFDRSIRGTSEFVDPSGTRYYHVDTTHPYHWVGPGHPQPVPTDQPDPPFPGAVPLQEVPAGQ